MSGRTGDSRKAALSQFVLHRRPAFSFLFLTSDALDGDVRDAMAKCFRQNCKDETLQPLPHMSEDPVRKRIDDAVASALGLDPEWMANIRRALSEEPSVTNRRYGV